MNCKSINSGEFFGNVSVVAQEHTFIQLFLAAESAEMLFPLGLSSCELTRQPFCSYSNFFVEGGPHRGLHKIEFSRQHFGMHINLPGRGEGWVGGCFSEMTNSLLAKQLPLVKYFPGFCLETTWAELFLAFLVASYSMLALVKPFST